MRYEFYPNESRIIDFVEFPMYVKFTEFNAEMLETNDYSEFVSDAFIKTCTSLENALKPFESKICQFYYKELSLPLLVMKKHSPFGYETFHMYADALRGLEDSALRESFLTKLLLMDTEAEAIAPEHLHAVSASFEAQMALLDRVEMNDDEKWKMIGFLRQPKQSVLKWLKLMEELEPIFEAYYCEYEGEIIRYGQALAKTFTDSNGQAISDMSNGIVTKDLLSNGNILISLVNGSNIEINTTSSVKYIRWGIHVEAFFEKMMLAKESQLKERVLVYKNLGDKTRYEVIRLIAEGVETSKEIADILGVSQATISYHISNLTISKIIILEKLDGKYRNRVNIDYLKEMHQKMLVDFKGDV